MGEQKQVVDYYLAEVESAAPLVVGNDSAEALLRLTGKNLRKLEALADLEIDPWDKNSAKLYRLQAEMALGSAKLLATIQAAALRGQKSDQLAAILQMIAQGPPAEEK